jgi:predicted transcriptional regulator of viral defense system
MKYIEFRELLKDFTVFSVNDIENTGKKFHRRRLHDWQKKGYIKKLIKGYYIFSDLERTEEVIFEIANRIYTPSYISFEMALSYYHLIPESVYEITSASTRRTYKFETPIAEFSYRSIKRCLFFGYNIVKNAGKSYKIATLEKAILDYFYINSKYRDEADFESLRFNKDIFFNQVNEKRFFGFLEKFDQAILSKRMKLFWDYMIN